MSNAFELAERELTACAKVANGREPGYVMDRFAAAGLWFVTGAVEKARESLQGSAQRGQQRADRKSATV